MPVRSEIRRRFLELVLSVAVLDAAIIAIWYAMDIRDASQRVQFRFGLGWMLATLLVVGIGLKRFHAARREALRGRSPRPHA